MVNQVHYAGPDYSEDVLKELAGRSKGLGFKVGRTESRFRAFW